MEKMKKHNEDYLIMSGKVVNNPNLTAIEKIILSEIIFRDKDKKKGCFCSNELLANKASCSVGTVSKSIKKLKKQGFIIYNETLDGRKHTRKVSEDLKFYKTGLQFDESSLTEKTGQSYKNDIQKDNNEKKEYKNNHKSSFKEEKYSIEEEKKLVEEKLMMRIRNRWDLFQELKKVYSDSYPISWDKKTTDDFISLCNKVYEQFKKKIMDGDRENQLKNFVTILAALISYRPKFFRDYLPWTFLNYWNQAIQGAKFERAITYVGPCNDDGFL